MGADGTLYLMTAAQFKERWLGLVPQQCGLSERTVLGVEAVIAYVDTQGRDDFEYSIASKAGALEYHRDRLERVQQDGDGEPGERVFNFDRDVRGHPYAPPIREADVIKEIARLEADPDIELAKRCREAIDWFEASAESITVWT